MSEERDERNAAALRLMFQCGRKLNQISSLSTHHTVLIMLKKDGSCTQRQLIEATGKRSATLSEQLTNMEKEGLIVRKRNEQDKRNVDVQLTEKGEKEAEEAMPFSQHLADAIFAGMKEKDLEKLIGYLSAVKERVDRYQGME